MKFGTHNLLDEKGTPTVFADITCFTEAVPTNITARLKRLGLLPKYKLIVCKQQRDLAVMINRSMFKVTRVYYLAVHGGIAKVTPHRGTFVVLLVARRSFKEWYTRHTKKRNIAVFDEHRINAAFIPYIRGEGTFRSAKWNEHTTITLGEVKRLKARGYVALAAGDVNTPHGVSGYRGVLDERGSHFDRVASSIATSKAEYLSKSGSDHPRLRVDVDLSM